MPAKAQAVRERYRSAEMLGGMLFMPSALGHPLPKSDVRGRSDLPLTTTLEQTSL